MQVVMLAGPGVEELADAPNANASRHAKSTMHRPRRAENTPTVSRALPRYQRKESNPLNSMVAKGTLA